MIRPMGCADAERKRVLQSIKPIFPAAPEVFGGSTSDMVPGAVVGGILKAYGHDAEVFVAILKALRWDGINGCYCFGYCGMFVGVESDGHVHS